jgi:hypothetical protein
MANWLQPGSMLALVPSILFAAAAYINEPDPADA